MRSYIKRIQKIDSKFLNNEIIKWIIFYENFNSISLLIKSKNNSLTRIKILLDLNSIFHLLGFHYFENLDKFRNFKKLKKFIENKRSIKNLILSNNFENDESKEKAYKYFYSKFMSIKKINNIILLNLLSKKTFIPKDIFQKVIKPTNNKQNFDLIRNTDFIIKIKDLNLNKNVLLFTKKSSPKCNLYKKIFSKELLFNPYKYKNEKILILYIISLRFNSNNYFKTFDYEEYKIDSFAFDKKINNL